MQELAWDFGNKIRFSENTVSLSSPILRIGEPVYACDRRCGTLYKVVVAPDTRRVTHVIVKKGWFLSIDRLIPIERLERAGLNGIYLKAASPELEQYTRYREEAFHKPPPGWEALEPYALADTLFWGSAGSDRPTALDASQETIADTFPDSDIYADLSARFKTRLALNAVQVQVERGLVILTGNVSTKADRTSAETIARKARGVIDVENKLMTDIDLFERVIAELASDPLMAAIPIKVIVDRGVVTLNGRVPKAQNRASAEAMALHTPGGMMIINNLTIEPDDISQPSR